MAALTATAGATVPRFDYTRWFGLRVADGIAFMTRTAVPFETVDEVASAYDAFVSRLESLDVSRLLTDLRPAPGRNDPEFEKVLRPLRRRMFQAFERRALVVASEIGRLHVRRHAAQDGFDVGVFLELDRAVSWLHHG